MNIHMYIVQVDEMVHEKRKSMHLVIGRKWEMYKENEIMECK